MKIEQYITKPLEYNQHTIKLSDLICPKINDIDPPVYINTGNKLKDDYVYFDKIVKYYVPELN